MGKQQNDINIFKLRTVAEYIMTSDEERELIDAALSFVKPKMMISFMFKKSMFQMKPVTDDLFQLKFKWMLHLEAVMLKEETSLNGIYDLLDPVYRFSSKEQFMNASVFDVFAAYTWVVDSMISIAEWKKENLSSKPTPKQLNAGIETFNELGDFVTLDSIAGGRPERYDEIRELPYGIILRKQRLNKLSAEYNELYAKQK